jgi:preprotein translocase SecE subunit
MAGFGQYLKDTRTEMRHVAWPTRTQTIVYTVLVFAISVGAAVYLGFFDFVFTQGLARVADTALSAQQAPASAIEISTTTAQ